MKAANSIRAARLLLENAESEIAASRAYYAMFYVAEALLAEEDQRSTTHSGVHSLFGSRFAKTRRLYPKYHRWLLDAFDTRLQGDYGLTSILTSDEADRMIDQAVEFLSAAQAFLTPESPAC